MQRISIVVVEGQTIRQVKVKHRIVFAAQKLILFFAYHFFKLLQKKQPHDIDWVVGVSEIAAYVHHISCALKNSVSV